MVPAIGAFRVVASSAFWASATSSCAWCIAAVAWATATASTVVVPSGWVVPACAEVRFAWAAMRLAWAVSRSTLAAASSIVARIWPAATVSPALTATEVRVPAFWKLRSSEVAGASVPVVLTVDCTEPTDAVTSRVEDCEAGDGPAEPIAP